MRKCGFCEKILVLWEHVNFVRKWDFCKKMWFLWGNVIFVRKYDVFEKMWFLPFLWENVNLERNVILWKMWENRGNNIFVRYDEFCENVTFSCKNCDFHFAFYPKFVTFLYIKATLLSIFQYIWKHIWRSLWSSIRKPPSAFHILTHFR